MLTTTPYVYEEENVERRKAIKPFGEITDSNRSSFRSNINSIPKFEYANASVDVNVEKDTGIFVPTRGGYVVAHGNSTETGIWAPSVLKKEQVSLKISNLPLNISRDDLSALIREKCDFPATSVNLVLDKDSHESRGFAFIRVSDIEDARCVVERLDRWVIDSYILTVRVLKE